MSAVVISQPMLFPWPGFFEQMALADRYLWLDDVQFSKGSFTNRIQIWHGGTTKWLTIPLMGSGTFLKILELEPRNDFRASHLAFLRQAFAGAPHARTALDIVEEAYANSSLCDVLVASAEVPARYLGLPKRRASLTSLLGAAGSGSMRVLELVRKVGGTRYLTGHGAAGYLDHEAFEKAGVSVEYMAYSLSEWPRCNQPSTPYLSVLDLIAHAGPMASSYLHPRTVHWQTFLKQREVK
jgi:hypothetical protein